ncbi:MAG: alpha/beta fold hydrolase [Acidobacteria bacterium]|nr:alpha/beta fold hydrolase [Acidobacteriota bacterium]
MQSESRESSYTVFVRGVPVGSEQTTLARTPDGWTITSTGRMGQPVDLVQRRVEVRYTEDWKPIELRVDASLRNQPLSVYTTVKDTLAVTDFSQDGRSGRKSDTIAADALLLPSPFWGPFEALALRLRGEEAGASVPAYVIQAPMQIRVGTSTSEQIQTADRLVTVRRTPLTLQAGGAPLEAELWGDEAGHLVRLTIPAQGVDVVRQDVASVSARRVPVSRANDEQVRIPSNGFSLAGTLSKPLDSGTTPRPAVILVGGSGPIDRDALVFGIPMLGQLAGAIADAGFIVLRYDKRGVGQSGGRIESAGIDDYAQDLRAAVELLADRPDVDRRRIAAIGHSEGGIVVLDAAGRDRRIAAVGLLATPGMIGAELILQQQAHLLDLAKTGEAERREKIALQRRIHDAVITGRGWETLPPALRRQVDNPEFRSLLLYDPAELVPQTRQPSLIVQGELDTQVVPSNADRLAALAHRRRGRAVEVAKLPGVNHLLAPAATGEVDEYLTLPDARVSGAVVSAVTAWLRKTVGAPAR